MLYLIAIFCSPLALLLAGKPIQAIFNLVLYVISIALWITIIFHSAAFLLWALAFIHAVLAIADRRADRRARRVIAALESARRNP
jgi:hypothetical protein